MSAYGYTTGFSFVLIDYQTQAWQTEEYSNWRKLDGLLNSVLEGAVPFVKATGPANDYVLTYSPVIAAYVNALLLSFSPNLANTGPVTINVNGLGAKNVYREGAILVGGELAADEYVKVIYDGTKFLVIEPKPQNFTIDDGSIGHAKLSTGHPVWDSSGNTTFDGNAVADGNVIGAKVREGTSVTSYRTLTHADAALDSGRLTISTSAPSGGSNGDIWFKYT
jgi:hypothetical protein